MAGFVAPLRQIFRRGPFLISKVAPRGAACSVQSNYFHTNLLTTPRPSSCPCPSVNLKSVIVSHGFASQSGIPGDPNLRDFDLVSTTTLKDIEERVMKVCKSYDRITADKLTVESHFINDIGLDSLDHVEVIMAMEDEFGFEIPDGDAERLLRPKDIIQYIADKEDIYE